MMYCVSINHKCAGADIRQKFSFNAEQRENIVKALISDGIQECALLCTCSRTEIYFFDEEEKSVEKVIRMLSEKADFDEDGIKRYIMCFYGKKAIEHLFRVECGIESMVLGEDEILGQTKNAYREAREWGAAGFELNVIFQSATACAKKIKTCTALSKTSSSISTLAASEAARLSEGKVKVLVIGATGKIGALTVKNLLSHKNVEVVVTLRKHSGDFFAKSFSAVQTVDYSQRYSAVRECDCVISATSGPHFTITAKELIEKCSGNIPELFIDLAVPPDVDKSVEYLDGVRLVGIDSFERLAAENNELKERSVEAACDIIAEETEKLYKNLIFHDFLPHIEKIKGKAEEIGFEKLIFKLRDELSSKELISLFRALYRLESEE